MVIEYDEEYITPQDPQYNQAVSKADAELRRLKEANAERQRKWRLARKIEKMKSQKLSEKNRCPHCNGEI